MIFHTMAQRSEPWFQLRVGKITGSGARHMLARTKTGFSAQRKDLCLQLACEAATGLSCEPNFVSTAAMLHGEVTEAAARHAYEALTGLLVSDCGFIEGEQHLIGAGCSPDGLVEDADGLRGILEIKCPTTKVFLGYLSGGILPPAHEAQVIHAMWCAGPEYGQFVDFFAFDDRLPDGLQTFLWREWRSEEKIARHDASVAEFAKEVNLEIASFEALRRGINHG
tara:strand:- start:1585 stop:2256 length:672 start_codon:yes stop_codon:yes gene_type:complete